MISKEAFEKIISDKSPEIKGKAVRLFNGIIQNANDYSKDPTTSKLRDWKSAEKELDDFLASIGEGATAERTFSSITTIVSYLTEQGYKISNRTGYNHRDKGLIRPRSDGKYYISDVLNYANSGILQKMDGTKIEVSDQDLDRKRKAEADNAEYQARINKIKAEAIEGRYIERHAFEIALAQRAALLKSDIEAFIRGHAEEMLTVGGGDLNKTPDFMEYVLHEFLKCLGRYAENREFKVPSTYTYEDKEEINAD